MTASPAPFPYKLIATDLDGTLLGPDETVSPRTRAALEAACARGAAHLVVTGRSVPWTRPVLEMLGHEGLAVCGQGAQLYHAGERRLLTSVTLDRRLAELALARIEDAVGPLALAVSRDGVDGQVLIGPGYGEGEGLLPSVPLESMAHAWAEPLNKLYIQHPTLSDDDLGRAAREAAGDLVSITVSGPRIVEILPLGLSKAKGLSLAARRLGVHASQTIAFGDMPNDIPMFGWAAHGVAMENAHPELRSVADEVTTSNADDGIALVLEKLLAQ
ncbi:HAD family phosphatase [Streptomyces sp. RKND-216]|uniref:HAD family hydrolase n=1 Tax=Streptomyces sp. RKND-216 TaxID=2562581 RepID=UPI00109DA37B|nr:HAD family hydrolase [Streptomyces sp. RKND-216]THA25532.1 HAD family phosphatase [Streptomyces sp. RKND-216]